MHNVAVSAQEGELHFKRSQSHPTGNRGGTGVAKIEAAGTTVVVPAVTIDQYLDMSGRTIVAKMDVEGHEFEALAGMTATLKNNKIFLQIECSLGADKLEEILNPLGYTLLGNLSHDYYFTNDTATFGGTI